MVKRSGYITGVCNSRLNALQDMVGTLVHDVQQIKALLPRGGEELKQ